MMKKEAEEQRIKKSLNMNESKLQAEIYEHSHHLLLYNSFIVQWLRHYLLVRPTIIPIFDQKAEKEAKERLGNKLAVTANDGTDLMSTKFRT